MVVTQNFVASRLPENFHRPLDFIPERWLKDPSKKTAIHTHLVLPFGHGMRGCIARRFAEQNMLLVVIKVRVGVMQGRSTECYKIMYSFIADSLFQDRIRGIAGRDGDRDAADQPTHATRDAAPE